jgi:hypothetical protein
MIHTPEQWADCRCSDPLWPHEIRNTKDSRLIARVANSDDARLIATAPKLLAACKAQHEAIDTLFAMLIDRSPPGKTFLPSKSGQLWDALVAGNAAIAKAEGK